MGEEGRIYFLLGTYSGLDPLDYVHVLLPHDFHVSQIYVILLFSDVTLLSPFVSITLFKKRRSFL